MLKKLTIAGLALLSSWSIAAQAASPADLDDLEIAHVAYSADSIDIRYAHLAMAISKNPAVHAFARTMIRDHTAVNEQALALLVRLGVDPICADGNETFPSAQMGSIGVSRRIVGNSSDALS